MNLHQLKLVKKKKGESYVMKPRLKMSTYLVDIDNFLAVTLLYV